MPHRMGRKVVVGLDDSPASRGAAAWALGTLARAGDSVHLLAAASPPLYTAAPAVPIATGGSVG